MIATLNNLRIVISIIGICCVWVPNRIKINGLTSAQMRFILLALFLGLFVLHDFFWMTTNMAEAGGAVIASSVTVFFVILLALIVQFDPWHLPLLRSRAAVAWPLIALALGVGAGLVGLVLSLEQGEGPQVVHLGLYSFIDIISQVGLLFSGCILLILFRGPTLDK